MSLTNSKGGLIVVLWTILVNQLTSYSCASYYLNFIISQEAAENGFWFNTTQDLVQFVTYLLYPITGLMADIYWTRYNTMYAAVYFNIIGTIILTVASFLSYFGQTATWPFVMVGMVLPLGLIQLGVALFTSNAVQYATDQMPGASSDELSSFVHWYFWAMFFGHGEANAVFLIVYLSSHSLITAVKLTLLVVCVIQVLCWVVGVVAITLLKHKLVNEPAGRNPLNHLAKVLRYSWHHKASRFEYRSAFTYGVESPSRLDFAKERFGGPYTTDEVEDTKTFFRVLVVMLSMSGYYFYDATVATTSHLRKVKAALDLTADGAFNYFAVMPFTGTTVTILVLIPLYHCCLRRFVKKYTPSMMKRIFCGLVFVLMSVMILQVMEFVLSVKVHTLTSCSRCNLTQNASYCLGNASEWKSEHSRNFNSDLLPYQVIFIPQVFNGVGFLLVYLTVIEFILAQAPRLMQGFLIGLWFFLASFKIPTAMILSIHVINCQFYAVGFRVAIMIILLPVYLVTAKKYKRRERDEYATINGQNIIEEYVVKALDRRDQYYQQLDDEDYDIFNDK